jgi:hypothetical protein
MARLLLQFKFGTRTRNTNASNKGRSRAPERQSERSVRTHRGLPRSAFGSIFKPRTGCGVRVKSTLAIPLSLAVALVVGAAAAAELPSRQSQPTPPAKTCWVNGQKGILIPGSDTCLRVSGSVTGQAAFGNVTTQSRP